MKFDDEIVNEFRGILKELFDERIKAAKNEAYKEFAERLKKQMYDCDFEKCGITNCVDVLDIDKILKKMVGEE